ncbi:archease [Geoalkalibacter halelectricus]|uniref:Archease n=2 Tax=Geoalkalibacter halelectricus TaxID=2847045 RepID=A0ABY5ZGL8_9BACT|nr:archease [Geoalkalibacter halelectricus]UWZ78298.1 archease [Geoalkalibacter halelectricus]
MGHYRLLEHTADMGLEAWGQSREELFVQAALALRAVMMGAARVESRRSISLDVEGFDDAELLVNWLAEVLFHFECRRFVPAGFILEFSAEGLHAQVQGEDFDPDRHTVEREVKAVTHHQVLVEQTPQGWHGRVYLDL